MIKKVRKLDPNHDWSFGQSKANYVNEQEAIRQNIITRVLSFKNDYFLDTEANIDWFSILGNRNNEKVIKDEVYRVVLATEGVVSTNNVEIIEVKDRQAVIKIELDTIYNNLIIERIGVFI